MPTDRPGNEVAETGLHCFRQSGNRHDRPAGVLQCTGQRLLRRLIERMQAAILPCDAVAQENHAAAIRQCNRLFAAAPGLFEFGQTDLDRHHTNRRRVAALRPLCIDRLRDEITWFISGTADAIETTGITTQRIPKIRAKGKIIADEALRLIPVAGSECQSIAVHQIDRDHFCVALNRLQRPVQAIDYRLVSRMR